MQDSVSKDRDKYIGGSDIPIIMNLSPFKSRYDLLLEKAGYKKDTFEGNVFTEYGNKMESKIRDYLNESLAKTKDNPFIEGKHIREAQEGEIIGVRIHTDGERVDDISGNMYILEIKTSSTIHEDVNDYKLYLVQLLFYMVNIAATSGILAVYERPEDLSEEFNPDRLQIWDIEAIDYLDLIAEISKAIDLFLEDLRVVKDNPNISEADLLPVEIPDIVDRIVALESQVTYLKTIEQTIEEDKERLRAALEAASVKAWVMPNGYKVSLVPDGVEIIEPSKRGG